MTLQERREAHLEFLYREGVLGRDCPSCAKIIEWFRTQWEGPEHRDYGSQPTWDGPKHMASPNCESGHRSHCSCDVCF